MKRFTCLSLYIYLVTVLMLQAGEKKQPPKTPDKMQKAIPALEAYAEKCMKTARVPGMSIIIMEKGKAPHIKCFGVKTTGSKDPITPQTLFQIGSASKAFTSVLAGMLASEGKLSWQDKVIKHDPEFIMDDPWVTREFMIEDLMSQRSGLPPQALSTMAFFTDKREDIIKAIGKVKPSSSFRSEFSYVNCLFLEAGKVFSKITGKSWEDNIREKIFIPLGMMDSQPLIKDANAGKTVSGHMIWEDKVIAVPKESIFNNWPDTLAPAGSICSNAQDMAKWLQFQIEDGKAGGKNLISDDNLKTIRTPRTYMGDNIFGRKSFYCESWIYSVADGKSPVIWHNGDTQSCKTMVAFSPELKTGIIVLTNLGASKAPEAIAFKYFDLYQSVKNSPDYLALELEKTKKAGQKNSGKTPHRPKKPVPPLPPEAYTGIYANEIMPRAEVLVKNGELAIVAGKLRQEIKLHHWSGNRFLCEIKYLFSPQSSCFIVFNIGPEGKAESMWFGPYEKTTRPLLKRLEIKNGK